MVQDPGTDFDVFVSYAHVDNELIQPAQQGWVSTLVQLLGVYLAKRLGRREAFSNWYDQQQLRGNSPIRDHIPEQAGRSAVFLAVLSPGYAASDFCLRELQAFVDTHRNTLAERLFIVEHAPLEPRQQMPEPFVDVRKYRFYKLDENQVPRTLAMPVPLPDEREYYQKIDDLARDIAGKLASVGQQSDSTPAVFLADVTDDLESRRDEARRYLDQAGIRILPTSSYRLVREDFERSLSADLANSAVFVQLLGPVAGKRPPDVPDGFGWLQLEGAKRANVPILQWRSPDLDTAKIELPLQKKLLELDTVRAMPFEDFKRSVVTSFKDLTARPVAAAPARAGAESSSVIFINADKVDKASADAIKDSLGDRCGWSMPLSLVVPDAKPDELQEDMEANLINSEGLVIVYGAARPAWVTGQLQLYRKLASRRAQSPRLIAIVNVPPEPKTPIPINLPGMVTIGIDRVAELVGSVLAQ
jgi:hypothetical protein